MALSVGVVGCGKASKNYHFPVISNVEELELYWVADIDERRAQEASSTTQVPYYDEIDEALADTPDVVHINTPPFTHCELTKKALRTGSHVLVEKPMAMTATECDEMSDVADETGRQLCVVHNNLFFDPMRDVLKSVDKGEYGELINVTSFLGGAPNPDEERDWVENSHGGGSLSDRLPHPIYLTTHFLERLDNQSVRIIKDENVTTDVSVQLSDGTTFGQVQASQRAIPAKEVYISGSKRRAYVDLLNYIAVEYSTINRSPVTIFTDNLEAAGQLTFNSITNGLEYLQELPKSGNRFAAPGHHRLMKEFARSIQADTEPPITPEQGRKVVEILELIDEQ